MTEKKSLLEFKISPENIRYQKERTEMMEKARFEMDWSLNEIKDEMEQLAVKLKNNDPDMSLPESEDLVSNFTLRKLMEDHIKYHGGWPALIEVMNGLCKDCYESSHEDQHEDNPWRTTHDQKK